TRRVDTIVLDKTGTVTQGRMAVEEVVGDAQTLRLAGALEALSEHPIAQAVAAAAAASGAPGDTAAEPETGGDGLVIGSDQVLDFRSAPGGGVSGVVRVAHSGLGMSSRVLVGRPSWLAQEGVA